MGLLKTIKLFKTTKLSYPTIADSKLTHGLVSFGLKTYMALEF